MTQNAIVTLTPEIVAAVFAELVCNGEGMPTAKGWAEILDTSGIGIAASNSVRRAFERHQWPSAWPLIDHLVRYFMPLVDAETRERAPAVLAQVREHEYDSLEDFFPWAWARTAAARCLAHAVDLGAYPACKNNPCATAAVVVCTIAEILANEVSESAAREFITSIEAIGTEVRS
ncbi:MAG: hypothetical protein JWN04_976 [Myxococcaceae bacterium]|nr:hypothetical protein [Myxococcaceae bacterium]